MIPWSDLMLYKRKEFSDVAMVQAFQRILLLKRLLLLPVRSKPVKSKPVVLSAFKIMLGVIDFSDLSIVRKELRTIG